MLACDIRNIFIGCCFRSKVSANDRYIDGERKIVAFFFSSFSFVQLDDLFIKNMFEFWEKVKHRHM